LGRGIRRRGLHHRGKEATRDLRKLYQITEKKEKTAELYMIDSSGVSIISKRGAGNNGWTLH